MRSPRTGRLVIDFQGEVVVDVPPRTVALDGPVYHRPLARPESQDALQANTFCLADPRPTHRSRRSAGLILTMAASPNL